MVFGLPPLPRAEEILTTPLGTVDQLATFLDIIDEINVDRAELLLTLARSVCESVVSPLPDAALPVVLSVAARGYVNPEGQAAETVGAVSSTWSSAGVYLLRAERLQLKSVAGRGGAFTVDPTPSDAGVNVPPWSENVTWLSGVPTVEEPIT